VSTALVDVLKSLTPQQRSALVMPNFEVVVARSDKVHVLTWTKLEWLDSFDVSLKKMPDGECLIYSVTYERKIYSS